MKTEPHIVTPEVVRLVDEYVSAELADAKKYSNSTPLDESGVFSLHRLAAEIYAHGYSDGSSVEMVRHQGVHLREFEAKK